MKCLSVIFSDSQTACKRLDIYSYIILTPLNKNYILDSIYYGSKANKKNKIHLIKYTHLISIEIENKSMSVDFNFTYIAKRRNA